MFSRLAFAFVFLCGGLQAAPALSVIQKPQPEIGSPFLWRLEGAGKKISWIFGTIHLSRPDMIALPSSVREALDSSDAVYTEIPADVTTMSAVVSKMMLPGGKTVDTVLGTKLTAELEEEIQQVDPELNLEPLARFKPWAVIAILLQLEDQMKYPSALALDMVLFQRGAMAGKEVGGLETPDEQIAVFEDFTDAEQVAMVRDTLKQLRSLRAQGLSVSDFLAKLYLAGDLDNLVTELHKLDCSSDDPKLNEKFMERLLFSRNALMAERILSRLRAHPDKSYFFAVGAAHLQGERGLLADLRKAGFKVTRAP